MEQVKFSFYQWEKRFRKIKKICLKSHWFYIVKLYENLSSLTSEQVFLTTRIFIMDSGLSPGVMPQNHGRTLLLWGVQSNEESDCSPAYLSPRKKVLMRNSSPVRISHRSFPSGSAGKESACNAGDTGDAGLSPVLSPGLLRMPWRRVFLSGESHGQRSLAGHSPKGLKGQTWLIDWVQAQESATFPKEWAPKVCSRSSWPTE